MDTHTPKPAWGQTMFASDPTSNYMLRRQDLVPFLCPRFAAGLVPDEYYLNVISPVLPCSTPIQLLPLTFFTSKTVSPFPHDVTM